jgi:hypothetical protein
MLVYVVASVGVLVALNALFVVVLARSHGEEQANERARPLSTPE